MSDLDHARPKIDEKPTEVKFAIHKVPSINLLHRVLMKSQSTSFLKTDRQIPVTKSFTSDERKQ